MFNIEYSPMSVCNTCKSTFFKATKVIYKVQENMILHFSWVEDHQSYSTWKLASYFLYWPLQFRPKKLTATGKRKCIAWENGMKTGPNKRPLISVSQCKMEIAGIIVQFNVVKTASCAQEKWMANAKNQISVTMAVSIFSCLDHTFPVHLFY